MSQADFQIRWMIRRDMPEVLEIERLCFPNPWSEDEFIRCLRQRNCIGMVTEHRQLEKVVGFVIYDLENTSLRLLNLAVEPAWQMRGVGRQMLDKLRLKLSHQKRNRILLEVRESNLDAQIFLRNQGFRATSVSKNFYEDTEEDAYVMQYRYRNAEAMETSA